MIGSSNVPTSGRCEEELPLFPGHQLLLWSGKGLWKQDQLWRFWYHNTSLIHLSSSLAQWSIHKGCVPQTPWSHNLQPSLVLLVVFLCNGHKTNIFLSSSHHTDGPLHLPSIYQYCILYYRWQCTFGFHVMCVAHQLAQQSGSIFPVSIQD